MLGLEKIKKGKAVTTLRDTILARPLCPDCSAPASQLAALTEDFKYAKDKTVSAFTDGRYFMRNLLRFWSKLGLNPLTALGNHIAHHTLACCPQEAAAQAGCYSMCESEAHTHNLETASLGNSQLMLLQRWRQGKKRLLSVLPYLNQHWHLQLTYKNCRQEVVEYESEWRMNPTDASHRRCAAETTVQIIKRTLQLPGREPVTADFDLH